MKTLGDRSTTLSSDIVGILASWKAMRPQVASSLLCAGTDGLLGLLCASCDTDIWAKERENHKLYIDNWLILSICLVWACQVCLLGYWNMSLVFLTLKSVLSPPARICFLHHLRLSLKFVVLPLLKVLSTPAQMDFPIPLSTIVYRESHFSTCSAW
jgi:hypothetical protein